ncbi:MAG: hypothetical protein HYT87_13755 [Nitrospirae bacterium]|nr:hypothetical protein [Nitrospirota bacterium]
MRFSGVGAFLLLFAGCVPYVEPDDDLPDVYSCEDVQDRLSFRRPIQALNLISTAYRSQCYDLVIKYGSKALRKYTHKTHFWSREVASIFIPEDMATGYVLESYERAYLSFLISASYMKKNEFEDSQVELRRMNDEMRAVLYTRGEDPVNILLQAIMWEKHGDAEEARVDWSRLGEFDQVGDTIRAYAAGRVEKIDLHPNATSDWKIFAFGQFPEVLWDLQFIHPKQGYLKVWTNKEFVTECASPTGVRISTTAWFNKIAMRHQHRYHPLMFAKSWIRLPIGMAYSITTVAAGSAVMVGGCGSGVALGLAIASLQGAAQGAVGLDSGDDIQLRGTAALCEVSVKGGSAIMSKAPEVLESAVRPDLRHWENVPEGFLITAKDEFVQEECYLPGRGIWRVL